MISFADTALLVAAKIRAQKRRTVITVVVAGVLFGFVLSAAIIWKSAAASVADFSESVTRGKSLVLASKIDTSDSNLMLDLGLIQQAEAAFQSDIASKEAYASTIGYDYDSSQETPAIITETNAQGQSFKRLNPASPIAQQLLQQARKASGVGLPEIRALTQDYETSNIFEIKGLDVVDGELKSDPVQPASVAAKLSPQGQLPYVLDESVLAPYIFKHDVAPGAIPIIIPFSAAEAELGLGSLPANASTKERLDRLQQVKSKVGSIRFELCYRNKIGLQQLAQPNKEFDGIVYQEPDSFCGAPVLVSDNRTPEQKSQAAKRDMFNRNFGIATEAEQQVVAYQVVGVVPDSQVGMSKDNLAKLVLSLLSPPGFVFSAITSQSYDTVVSGNNMLSRIFTTSDSTADTITMRNYIIEFPNQAEATRFLRDNTCDPSRGCANNYTFTQFGSNSIQLASMAQSLQATFLYAAGIIAAIAVVISAGTFGRLIADSHHETAVFLAFGAKRLDIAIIYLAYALFLSTLTAVFALCLAYTIALVIHVLLASQLQNELQLTYGFADNVQAWLIGFVPTETAVVAMLIIISGSLGMLFSLADIKRDIAVDLKEN